MPIELTDRDIELYVEQIFQLHSTAGGRARAIIDLWWTTIGEDEGLHRFVAAALKVARREDRREPYVDQ